MEMKCNKCGKPVTQKVVDYSTKAFGRILCFECQKEGKAETGNTSSKTLGEYQQKQENKEDRIVMQCCLKVAGNIVSTHSRELPIPSAVVAYAQELFKELNRR